MRRPTPSARTVLHPKAMPVSSSSSHPLGLTRYRDGMADHLGHGSGNGHRPSHARVKIYSVFRPRPRTQRPIKDVTCGEITGSAACCCARRELSAFTTIIDVVFDTSGGEVDDFTFPITGRTGDDYDRGLASAAPERSCNTGDPWTALQVS